MNLMAEKIKEFSRSLGKGKTLTDSVELLTYETDAGLESGTPYGVIFPQTTQDVMLYVSWAGQNGVPVIARGAGTGTSGGAVAEHGGLLVVFTRMKALLELDELGRRAVVQPAMTTFALDELVAAKGLCFPPDPSSGRVCTIGGNVAENSGGPRCFKYGVMTHYITGLMLVTAEGHLLRLGGKALDYPEYDFTGVVTGSEGTLGIVTEATLRLIRRPPASTVLMAAFGTVEEAGQAVSEIIASGLVPASIEMLDQSVLQIVEDYSHLGLPVEAAAALFIEVDGYEDSLSAQVEQISIILHRHHVSELTLARDAAEREKIWRARKDSGGALARLAPAYYPMDTTIPRSKIAQAMEAITRACQEEGLEVNYMLHAGDGNLHPNILIQDNRDPALMQRVMAANRKGVEFCVSQGGSISGEHGIGMEHRALMPLMYSATELRTMLDIKAVFDPQELVNPGKIFPTGIAEFEPLSASDKPPTSPFLPSSAEEAAAAMLACGENVPPLDLIIRGGGSKSRLIPSAQVTLSTAKLDGVRVISSEDLYLTAGAGATLAEVQQALSNQRVWLPLVSPWAEATLGGIISTNFNAPLRMRYTYGSLRDLLLALTAVLPDGRIVHFGRAVVKNVAGYDMPKLFVGAHGTLGLITEVTLKIAPLPPWRMTLALAIDDLETGLALGRRLQRICLTASALLLCHGCEVPGAAQAAYHLLYTAEGIREDVEAELSEVRRALREEGGPDAVLLEAVSGSQVWADWLGGASFEETTLRLGVAPGDLSDVVRAALPSMTAAAWMADLPNGLLYLRGVLALDSLATLRQAALAAGGYAVVLDAPFLPQGFDRWGYRPDSLELMQRLKRRWDGQGVVNRRVFMVG